MVMKIEQALEKYPGLRERLGTVPDPHLAKEYGLTRPRIYQFRVALGIPAATKRKPRKQAHGFRNRVFAALVEHWLAKGQTVESLAEELGHGSGRVRDWMVGANGRRPGWGDLNAVAAKVGLEVRMRGTRVALVPMAGRFGGGKGSAVFNLGDGESF